MARSALTHVFFVSISQIALPVVKAGVGGANILVEKKTQLVKITTQCNKLKYDIRLKLKLKTLFREIVLTSNKCFSIVRYIRTKLGTH